MHVTVIPGVGPATAERLRRVGIHTVAELETVSVDELVRLLGKAHGTGLYALARAEDDRPVVAERETKSVSVEGTYDDRPDRPHADGGPADPAGRRASPSGCASTACRAARSRSRSGCTTSPRSAARRRCPPPPTSAAHDRPAGPRPARRPRHLRRRPAARRRRLRAGRLDPGGPVRRRRPRTTRRHAAPDEPPRGPPRRPGRPGMDVVHAEMGRGWVWGSGRGVVTVRFETARDPAGPVRSLRRSTTRRSARGDRRSRPMSGVNRTSLARPQLRALPQVVGVDDGDHRVAAGRRVVGQEHHRLPVRRHLHRPEHHPLAGQLVVPAPRERGSVEPQPDPVGVGRRRRTAPRTAASSASAANQSSRGPGRDPQRPGRPRARGVVRLRRLPAARPTGSTVAGHRPAAGRPRRGCRSSASPSTGVDRDPAGDRDVAAHARRRRRRAGARAPGRQPHRLGVRRRRAVDGHRHGAPVTATQRPPSARSSSPPSVTSSTAASGGLPTSRLARRRPGRRGPGARHPEVGQAEPAAVLDRGERRRRRARAAVAHRGDEPHPGARRQQRRLVAGGVPQRRVGAAEQPPPARRRGRVDAAPRPGEADRAGGHRGPRRVEPGYGQLARAARRGRRSPGAKPQNAATYSIAGVRATTPSSSVIPSARATNPRSAPS